MKHPCHLPDPFSVTFSLNSPLITYFNKPERTTLKDVRHSSKVPTGEFADTVIDSACVICYDKEADTMVLPCGHTVVCWTCWRSRVNTGRVCNACNPLSVRCSC
jgi:hypothetical protein